MIIPVKFVYICYLKLVFLLFYLFDNVELELIYFIQLVLQHQTVAGDAKSYYGDAI